MNQTASSEFRPVIGIVMGSDSDLPVMEPAAQIIRQFGIEPELTIVSAHRTPDRLRDYARSAVARGLKVIIAGAGGDAHLPGMLAAQTVVPVIGVPVKSSNSIDGWDSILSILQMPGGIPVATVALNGGKNAGLLALQLLAIQDEALLNRLERFRCEQEEQVLQTVQKVKDQGFYNGFDGSGK